MRAPSVRVSCSLLILQLIKPNILAGVSTGLLGAGPLPHCPGVDRQEGQVSGERWLLQELEDGSQQEPKDICGGKHRGLHWDPGELCLPTGPLKDIQTYLFPEATSPEQLSMGSVTCHGG